MRYFVYFLISTSLYAQIDLPTTLPPEDSVTHAEFLNTPEVMDLIKKEEKNGAICNLKVKYALHVAYWSPNNTLSTKCHHPKYTAKIKAKFRMGKPPRLLSVKHKRKFKK